MAKTLRRCLWLLPLLVLFGAGFAVAARYDLAIDTALYNPQDGFAIFMEAFGWAVAYLPVVLLLLLAITEKSPRWGWQKPAAVVVLAGLVPVLLYASYGYMKNRGWASGLLDWRFLGTCLVCLALLLCAAFAVKRLPTGQTRHRLLFYAAFATAVALGGEVLVFLLKQLWARTRFDDMVAAGSFADFTPWYHLLGNGGSSFPSGHTAKAACVLSLVALCDGFPALQKKRWLVYTGCWVYIALMAYARLRIGRHFLSDTLGAALLIAALVWLLRHNRWHRTALVKTKELA